MAVNLIETLRDEFGTHIEAQAGKQKATVSIYKGSLANLGVQVVCQNASHRAFRGAGKFFKDIGAALDNYRSAEMRAIIELAASVEKEVAA